MAGCPGGALLLSSGSRADLSSHEAPRGAGRGWCAAGRRLLARLGGARGRAGGGHGHDPRSVRAGPHDALRAPPLAAGREQPASVRPQGTWLAARAARGNGEPCATGEGGSPGGWARPEGYAREVVGVVGGVERVLRVDAAGVEQAALSAARVAEPRLRPFGSVEGASGARCGSQRTGEVESERCRRALGLGAPVRDSGRAAAAGAALLPASRWPLQPPSSGRGPRRCRRPRGQAPPARRASGAAEARRRLGAVPRCRCGGADAEGVRTEGTRGRVKSPRVVEASRHRQTRAPGCGRRGPELRASSWPGPFAV